MIKNVQIRDQEKGIVAVTLTGKIYVEESIAIRERLMEYLERGFREFEIDFSEVAYIDSMGLGVLVAIHKQAKDNGGGVVILGLQGLVKDVFELSKMHLLFQIR